MKMYRRGVNNLIGLDLFSACNRGHWGRGLDGASQRQERQNLHQHGKYLQLLITDFQLFE
jgi:hypothetical protein